MDIDALFAAALARDSKAIAELAKIAEQPSTDDQRTILHIACMNENTEPRVQFILREFSSKNLLVKLDKYKQTALHLAAGRGYTKVVEILIDAARSSLPCTATDDSHNPVGQFQEFLRQTNDMGNTALHHQAVTSHNPVGRFEEFLRQTNYMGNTALHQAVTSGDVFTVKRLVKADPNDGHVQNLGGYSPVYLAAKLGYNDIVKMICKNCTAPSLDGPAGTTALHAAISQLNQARQNDKDVVMVLMGSAKRSSLLKDAPNKDFAALFDRTDHENRTLLSLAVHKNQLDEVKLILKEDPAYERVSQSKRSDLKSLIYKASKEGYKGIVKVLCEKYEAGKTKYAGHSLLIDAIKRGDKEIFFTLLKYDARLVTYETFTKWTALHYAAFYNFDSIVDEIVQAQVDVEYKPVYGASVETPLMVAAKQGHTSTVILLMKLLPELSCVAVNDKGQNILHIAVVRSNKDMIQSILAYCPESCTDKILNAKDVNGDTPLHLLIYHGCFVPQLIKHERVNTMVENNQDWTPFDMLYFQDKVTADQVKIKILFNDIQATQQSKFWPGSTKGTLENLKSAVPPSTRSLKDAEFMREIQVMTKKELEEMKEETKRYRERTTTQIIVTALITTVTFTVGFTMPGGYHQSGESEEGLVLLSKKKAFQIFMVSDASALALSITSLFIYFVSSLYDNPKQVSQFDAASTGLNIVSVVAMMLTFIAGIYVVLSNSPGLALISCIICSIFFLSIIVLLIKLMFDCKTRRKLKV